MMFHPRNEPNWKVLQLKNNWCQLGVGSCDTSVKSGGKLIKKAEFLWFDFSVGQNRYIFFIILGIFIFMCLTACLYSILNVILWLLHFSDESKKKKNPLAENWGYLQADGHSWNRIRMFWSFKLEQLAASHRISNLWAEVHTEAKGTRENFAKQVLESTERAWKDSTGYKHYNKKKLKWTTVLIGRYYYYYLN